MKRSAKFQTARALTMALAAVALLGTAFTGPALSATQTSQPARCTAGALRVSAVRQTASTMPGIITAVRFRNAGKTTCWLRGWPKVKVPPRGHGHPAVKVKYFKVTGAWSVAVTRVTLRPGDSAAANMMIGNAVRPGSCGSRTWSITPPGGKRAVAVHERKSWPSACSGTGLAVSPVYPGRYAPLVGDYPR
jgi:hypothetical protein